MTSYNKTIPFLILLFSAIIVFFVGSSFKPKKRATFNVNIAYDTTAFFNSKDTILHLPKSTLQWVDFKGKPDNQSHTVANSAVGFKFTAGIQSQDKNTTVHLKISSFFVRSKSWGKTKNLNNYILLHEQKHFDLARYGAELFRRNLLQQKMNASNASNFINKAYDDAWNTYLTLQAQYDKETNHSINTAQQEIWNKKIDSLLLECK